MKLFRVPRSTFSRYLLKLFPLFLVVLEAIPCYPVNVFIAALSLYSFGITTPFMRLSPPAFPR